MFRYWVSVLKRPEQCGDEQRHDSTPDHSRRNHRLPRWLGLLEPVTQERNAAKAYGNDACPEDQVQQTV